MKVYLSLFIFFCFLFSCAPFSLQTYTTEYHYENLRVDNASNPSWTEKIVYLFDHRENGRVHSAFVYHDGNTETLAAFLLYTYWDLNQAGYANIDNRLRMIERYTDNDIFRADEQTKDPVKAAAKLIRYDVYDTDVRDGKTLSVTTYIYHPEDPVTENRNVPVQSAEYRYFENIADRFLPEEEIFRLFLAEKWIYRSTAIMEYEYFNGKKQLTRKKYYLNPVDENSWYQIEESFYDQNGCLTRKELYTAEEYKKGVDVRVPEKTVLYITEVK